MITYKQTKKSNFTLVEFELSDGLISPSDLAAAVAAAPDVAGDGVVLSGRGPVYLYAALVHAYHATRWVATFDPRLGGGVVVHRHHPDAPRVGDVVPVA